MFLNKGEGRESGAPKLPKMFVFDLKNDFFCPKTKKKLQNLRLKKLDIGGSILDTFQEFENIRDLAFRSIRRSIYSTLDSRL